MIAAKGPGRGHAFGAVTIVNATATGVGCSLAVQASTTAEWSWGAVKGQARVRPDIGDKLVESVRTRACHALQLGQLRAEVVVRCPFPPSRGLKTSSSVAAALVRAAADAAGKSLPDDEVAALAVRASRDAEVTITGAFDDQVATLRGGCHLTENRSLSILQSIPAPRAHVAIWVPKAKIPKSSVRDVDVSSARRPVMEAIRLVQAGRIAEAMTLNGRAYTTAYEAAGLPVTSRPADVALACGAMGAGLSGTGPAVAALFANTVELPAVAGGRWFWTSVAPGQLSPIQSGFPLTESVRGRGP